MRIGVFDTVTGYLLRTVKAPALEGQAQDGEVAFAMPDSVPSRIADERAYKLDGTGQPVWTPQAIPVVAPTLDEARATKLVAIQAAKAAALQAMTYLGYRVTLSVQDQVDVSTQLAILGAAPAGSTTVWEIVDNVFLIWGLSDLQALQGAGIAHVQGVYANTAALVGQVAAAADVASVEAVGETAGWPA